MKGKEELEAMDMKDLASAKRRLSATIEQKIREFEQAAGLRVTGIKIKRHQQGVQSVGVAVELPE